MNSPSSNFRCQRTRCLPWVLAAFVLLATVPASAQVGSSQDDERPGTVIEDEVFVQGSPPDIPTSNTVAAKLPLSLRETPASVGVVDAETLEQQDAKVMGDALRNVSGVNVQTINGVSDFFVVRGLDSVSSGLILTDGAPEPETTFYQLYNVERVEVLKGPSAFLYGGSPLGGTVNLVRKQPLFGGDFTRLSLQGGSFSTYEGTLDTNFVNDDGNFSFRLNGLFRTSDGYRDDKDSEIFAINPSFTWRPSERTSVTVNLESVDSEFKTDAGLPVYAANPFGGPLEIADVPRTRNYQSPFDISDQQIDRVQVDIQSDVSDTFTLRNKTWYRSLDWESRGTIFNGAFPIPLFGTQVFRSLLSLDDDQTLYGNQFEGLWRVETGSVTHNLLLGIEVSRLTDKFNFDVFLLPAINLDTPFETAQEPLFALPGQSLGADAEQDVIAPYIVDQITFSEHFQLLLGVRWDNLDFQDDVQRFSNSYDEVSPMVGIVVSPSETVSLYANYSEAFAPPSTFGIAANLEPEESEQIEAGIKADVFGGRGQLSLAAFRVDRLNIAIPDAFGITRQNGDQRAEGLEFEIAGELAPGLRASLAYAYTDAELTSFAEILILPTDPTQFFVADYTGNTPAFTPEHLLSLWLSQRFGRFTLGGGLRYVGEQFIDEDNAFELDDYLLLDLSLAYDLGPWELQVNLRNLTDEEYFTRGFGNTSVLPAPGVEAYGGIAYTF